MTWLFICLASGRFCFDWRCFGAAMQLHRWWQTDKIETEA